MDDMIIKSSKQQKLDKHLTSVFKRFWQYDMRFDLKKCTFEVNANKFLVFYLTKRGIKANLDKCEIVIKIEALITKKGIMKLNNTLTTLNRFISRLDQHIFPFYKLHKK